MILKGLSKLYMRLTGWKVEGEIPPEIPKCVLIAVPHTSSWDFPYSMAGCFIKEVPLRFLAKKELFAFPAGPVLRSIGGIPVNRGDRRNKMVERMVGLIRDTEKIALLIPAEGTRKPVKKWKKGFYIIAQEAQVPIIPGFLDYKRKVAGFGKPFYPTGDYEADILKIKDFYKDKTPKHPEMFDY